MTDREFLTAAQRQERQWIAMMLRFRATALLVAGQRDEAATMTEAADYVERLGRSAEAEDAIIIEDAVA